MSVTCRSAISGFLDDIMVPIGIPAHINSSSESQMSSLYFVSFKEVPRLTEKAEVSSWIASAVNYLPPSKSARCGCTWTDMLCAALAPHHSLQPSLVLQPVMWHLLVSCSSPSGCSPLCRCARTRQPASCAGNVLSWKLVCLQLQGRVMAACMHLYAACMQLCLVLRYSSSTLQLQHAGVQTQPDSSHQRSEGWPASQQERTLQGLSRHLSRQGSCDQGRQTHRAAPPDRCAHWHHCAPYPRAPMPCVWWPPRRPSKPAHAADHR